MRSPPAPAAPHRLSCPDLIRASILGLPVVEARKGWIEFDAGGCTIALHRGARKPRLDFAASEPLDRLRDDLQAKRVKLQEIKEDVLGRGRYCRGRDAEGNPFQISTGY